MEEKKVLLSVKNLSVKFRVRGRTLTAIRNVSLDIYEDESIAIVGESGCGKSVLTKTFAGMLDNNGYIDEGDIFFHDTEFIDTVASVNPVALRLMARFERRLNTYSKLELGADTYREILAMEKEKRERQTLNEADAAAFEAERKELIFQRTEVHNFKQTLDSAREKDKIREAARTIAEYDAKLKALEDRKKATIREHTRKTKGDTAYNREYARKMAQLQAQYKRQCEGEISQATRERNKILAKEIYLSLSRYPSARRVKLLRQLFTAMRKAMKLGGISMTSPSATACSITPCSGSSIWMRRPPPSTDCLC